MPRLEMVPGPAGGVFSAWFIYMQAPGIADALQKWFGFIHRLLVNKYYADDFNQKVFGDGARGIGGLLWRYGDVKLIDGGMVNGTAHAIGKLSGVIRQVQSGYLYHYAFAMIFGLALILGWVVLL